MQGTLAGNPISVGAADPTLVTAPVRFTKVRIGDLHLIALGVDGNAYTAGISFKHLTIKD
jgi:hypothetical protein